jgi:hypothetical protein
VVSCGAMVVSLKLEVSEIKKEVATATHQPLGDGDAVLIRAGRARKIHCTY